MFALKMFYKYLIATGFHAHLFKMFSKCFASNDLKIFVTNVFMRLFPECLLNVICKHFQTNMAVKK